ncbi:LPS export ABC transporter periplasmic protein LptC [Alkanindiges illinoisensis]|uniref:LPS export ABC transporter periplasmic protein LptC n=1 Tax=Alkanindiges illinoisensis TaxID=197183 RepID=UPI00047C0588|nr:LPS export ABC transporter periplasmic protein LptC [Alkanindiges illinoisensis]
MDTRLLYVIALGIAVVSGLFYFYSGKSAHLNAENNQDLSYNATNIHLLKTTETGQLEATTTASKLQRWEQENRSELEQLQTTWYQQGQPAATFNADKAIGYNNNEKVILTGNVRAHRLASNEQAAITFTTNQLTGYPKQNRIETDQPVLIQTNQGQFSSQGLNANLDQGQYNLFRIRGQYAPASGS